MAIILPELGGVTIEVPSGHEVSQDYEEIGGYSDIRALDGTAIRQSNWARLSTTLSGRGFFPTGLSQLDYSRPMVLKCCTPRIVSSQGRLSAAIPTKRRNDVPLFVTAVLNATDTRRVPFVLSGNSVAITAVNGAVDYLVCYYPQITVYANPIREENSRHDDEYSWQLECEEV